MLAALVALEAVVELAPIIGPVRALLEAAAAHVGHLLVRELAEPAEPCRIRDRARLSFHESDVVGVRDNPSTHT